MTKDDDLFAHPTQSDDSGWFDRFYLNVHSRAVDLTLAQGVGIYPNVGVTDGFGTLVRGGRQWNVRASAEAIGDPVLPAVGPLGVEIREPLQKWRFRLGPNDQGISWDLEFEAAFPPVDAGKIQRRAREGELFDWSHFIQVGRVEGEVVVQHERIPVAGEDWVAIRDRSWGVRPMDVPKGVPPRRHDWVVARFPEGAFFFLLADGRSGPRLLAGALDQKSRRRRIVELSRRHEEDGGRFLGATIEARLEDGETARVRARRLEGRTAHLRGGLYGGWKGARQGQRRGPLLVEGEEWNFDDRDLMAEVVGLNDHVCEFELAGTKGFGLYELNHGT